MCRSRLRGSFASLEVEVTLKKRKIYSELEPLTSVVPAAQGNESLASVQENSDLSAKASLPGRPTDAASSAEAGRQGPEKRGAQPAPKLLLVGGCKSILGLPSVCGYDAGRSGNPGLR